MPRQETDHALLCHHDRQGEDFAVFSMCSTSTLCLKDWSGGRGNKKNVCFSRSVSLVGEKERKMLKEIVKQAKRPVKSRILAPGEQ